MKEITDTSFSKMVKIAVTRKSIGISFQEVSTNTCTYSSVWSEECEQYLYRIEEISTTAPYSRDEKEYVFEIEHNVENTRDFESSHPFEDFLVEDAIVFVSPELVRIVDPEVNQKKQFALIVEKLKNRPFYLQYALRWYSKYLGFRIPRSVLVEREDGTYTVEEYKAMAEDPLFLEWVQDTLNCHEEYLHSH